MSKIQKEAELYKDCSTPKLKRVILNYKLLSYSNSKNFNFFSSLFFMFVPFLIFFNLSIVSFFSIITVHYFFFHKFLYEKKKIKIVSDEEKEEIDEVLKILNSYLKERETKNPS
jgi:hypothetical protein